MYLCTINSPLFEIHVIFNFKSPTVAPSSSVTCIDTLGWEDKWGNGCEYYREVQDPECLFGNYHTGEMGPASDNCCYCKDPTVSPDAFS